jgi:hypothetical protein
MKLPIGINVAQPRPAPSRQGQPVDRNSTKEWYPPMWMGASLPVWVRILIHNHFAVHWSRWHIAILCTFASIYISVLALLQKIFLDRKAAKTWIREPPVFIVGHWRTGTTLLHELLTLDKRHTAPTGYQCFAPHDFLLTQRLRFGSLPRFLFPAHRPMDNMAYGLEYPQEEEFAMCLLGQPSPYLAIAFPNHQAQYQQFFDLESLTPSELKSWKEALFRFLQQVYFRRPKRLILKSPTSSFRIKELLELFPQANFIHIVRDPYVLFPSTMHLHKCLFRTYGLQRPDLTELEEQVLSIFSRLYEKLEQGRQLVDPSRFYELRYEDLIRAPEEELRRLYEHLGLGGFEEYRPLLKQYLADRADYETNGYGLTARERAMITERWGEVIRRYGYDKTVSPPQAPVEVVATGGNRLDDVGPGSHPHSRPPRTR